MIFNITNSFRINSKIFVAINSYSLLLFINKKINIDKNFIFWPDGIICKLYGFDKIPGRDIFKQLLSQNIKFCLITSPNILNKFTEKIQNDIELVEVGFDNLDILFSNIKNITSEVVVITLPTPKQEMLALLLHNKFKNKTFLCLGGAVNMYLGIEKSCPQWLSNIGLEFIWRLHKEPLRRLKRLLTLVKIYKLIYANIKFIKKY
jgi:exopolysaccharide biosynthesis WecB/TagA/CpsF family protein